MARLVLGPLLRWVGATEATVWVETDVACEVAVRGHTARTFRVGAHHYGLVRVDGLVEGEEHEYAVHLDGEQRWPEPGTAFPPSVIRTLGHAGHLQLAFGSCRVAVPHEPPYTLTKDEHPEGKERDALVALALRMMETPHDAWPHALVMLGDQVYVDEGSPAARDYIASRRDPGVPPGRETADFEEYTRLYWESWQEPVLRWLLSTVPSAMIFDDHEIHDDWNASESWVADMDGTPWWRERLIGGFMSYWLYQHMGNLSPRELDADPLWQAVREAEDAEPLLRDFAARLVDRADGSRWSFHRDFGRTRLVMVDSRGGRVLQDGRRAMVDDEEWQWIVDHATGDVDHLLIGSSLPVFLTAGAHHLEAWNEAVCAGAWGRLAARAGERLRRGLDLEHWAAFGESFTRIVRLLAEVGAGAHGAPPASIVVLGGDVHHAYLAEIGFRREAGVRSHVYQAVCSPFRNPLDKRERRAIHLIDSRPARALTGALARLAGVTPPEARWRLASEPVFDNQVATLDLRGRRSDLRIERTVPRGDRPELVVSFRRRLS